MKESAKNILFSILIFIALTLMAFIIPYMMSETDDESGNITKESTITINNEGIVSCESIIKFLPTNDYEKIQLLMYKEIDERKYKLNIKSITIDDNVVEGYNPKNKSKIYYMLAKDSNVIYLYNLDYLAEDEHVIKINYEYNTFDVIEEYNDISLIKLSCDNQFKENMVRIIFPEEINELTSQKLLGNVKKISSREWLIDMTKLDSLNHYLGFVIKDANIEYSKNIDEDYYSSFWRYINVVEEKVLFQNVFYAVFGILILCLIILAFLPRRVKFSKEYIRETNKVIEPILAEAIIDRKIGAKELIMSGIADMINRGNLQCVDNNVIKLIHKENLSEYELKILEMVFRGMDVINFEYLKDIFLHENINTKVFYGRFKELRQNILNTLFAKEIYNYKAEKLLRIIRKISKAMYIEIIFLLLLAIAPITLISELIVANLIFLGIGYIVDKKKKRDDYFIDFTCSALGKFMNFLLITPLVLAFSIIAIYYYIDYMGVYLIVLILWNLNLLVSKLSNIHIFTKKGKEEYKKAHGLKSYIEDYSLMKERELESSILWDDYLTYAIAFGISNKVTDQLGENLMKANIKLQKIDKFLRF